MKIHFVKSSFNESSSNLEFSNSDPEMRVKGSVLRVSCDPGFELNSAKRKVRCRRGEWRPKSPECSPVKCRLPRGEEGGKFIIDSSTVILPDEGEVRNGVTVLLQCEPGYFLDGEPRRRCLAGEWTGGGAAMPRSVLPAVPPRSMPDNNCYCFYLQLQRRSMPDNICCCCCYAPCCYGEKFKIKA